MKKLALVLPLLVTTACGKAQPNSAEIIVKAQVKEAVCHAPTAVIVCALPDKSQVLSVIDGSTPWKVFPLVEAPKKDGAPPAAPGAGSGAAAPQAGSGSAK